LKSAPIHPGEIMREADGDSPSGGLELSVGFC
jgi:hypothetical protein